MQQHQPNSSAHQFRPTFQRAPVHPARRDDSREDNDEEYAAAPPGGGGGDGRFYNGSFEDDYDGGAGHRSFERESSCEDYSTEQRQLDYAHRQRDYYVSQEGAGSELGTDADWDPLSYVSQPNRPRSFVTDR